MATYETVVKRGLVFTAAGAAEADVGIIGEKIAAVGMNLQGDHEIDAAGLYVFPGFIDPHVHLQMPAGDLVSTDDFFTGTVAAACGGTTTIIDFIEGDAAGSLVEAAQSRRAEADGTAAVDYSLHLTGNSDRPDFLDEIGLLAGQGYTSLKIYTTYEGLMVGDAAILRLFHTARRHGVLPIIHAENDAIVASMQASLLQAGHTAPRYHPQSRPCIAEAEAIGSVLALARTAEVPVYIVHLSCAESLDVVERARAAGQRVYVEVTPHHLLLDEGENARPGLEGAKYCCAPPLRERGNLEVLWRGIAQGRVQTIATDHCPWDYRTRQERAAENFTKIPNGMPGIETRIPLIYHHGVNAGRISLDQFVELCASAPARLFGLYPRKGAILPGADADLVLFDPDYDVTLRVDALHQRVDYCPFEGWTVRGYPRAVLLRGKMIVAEGEFIGRRGDGVFLPRRPHAREGARTGDRR